MGGIDVKAILADCGLRANKSLGQNFLADQDIVDKIVDAVDPDGDDYIIEIGPGLGALTVPISRRAGRFTAVEVDRVLAARLDVDVVRGDFLKYDIPPSATKVVGSLPYYITAACIRRILNSDAQLKLAVLIIQKEVADKLLAEPGDKNYCLLTLETACRATVEVINDLPPSCFYPQPNVFSQAVLLSMYAKPPVDAERDRLLKVITAAFSTRRKTLVNCLQTLGFSKEKIINVLGECGFAADVRGERLSVYDFGEITKKLFDNI